MMFWIEYSALGIFASSIFFIAYTISNTLQEKARFYKEQAEAISETDISANEPIQWIYSLGENPWIEKKAAKRRCESDPIENYSANGIFGIMN